jgi:hypothetical protein
MHLLLPPPPHAISQTDKNVYFILTGDENSVKANTKKDPKHKHV